jgi:ferrochelatase
VTVGVLVMAYGTPSGPDDIEAYYTDIRRGRPPTDEQLADLRRRYDAIGGVSPLRQRTGAQAGALGVALGDGYRVALGMKHARPSIEDGVAELADAGVARTVGLVLAPHYSALSIGEYVERATVAARQRAMAMAFVESWYDAPGYTDLLAERVRDAMAAVPAGSHLLVTAHSLPARILQRGDPYPTQLAETASAIATRAGVNRWSVAYQSAGRTPEPWLGPDVRDVIVERGGPGVVVCPAGFVSDHLEVLYDLDVEAARVAEEHGIAFARTAMPNDDPPFIATLTEVVRAR